MHEQRRILCFESERTDFRETTELVSAASEETSRFGGHASGGGNHVARREWDVGTMD